MRLIDADKLHFSPRFAWTTPDREEMVPVLAIDKKYVDKAPTVDAVEVVHTSWEHEGCDIFHCSVCGYVDAFPHMEDGVRPHKYCPNCGAKMDGGSNETD